MDKLFTVFDVLACTDWITPLLGILDPSTRAIEVKGEDLWAVDQLKRKGVTVKRIQTMPIDKIVFEVPKEQVKLAILLLQKMGVDIQPRKGL